MLLGHALIEQKLLNSLGGSHKVSCKYVDPSGTSGEIDVGEKTWLLSTVAALFCRGSNGCGWNHSLGSSDITKSYACLDGK